MAKSAKSGIRERYKPERVTENWRELTEALPHMNEDELKAALDMELARTERRADFVLRLHRKYTKLRQLREIEEYLK